MNKLTSAFLFAKLKIKGFMKGEVGAVDIVAIVVLIGVAVVLGIVFRDEVTKLIQNFFQNSVSGEMDKVFKKK